MTTATLPSDVSGRDRFVLSHRPPVPRPSTDAEGAGRLQGLLVEEERTARGTIAPIATAFLTTRECPWRCTMCDLWRFTTSTRTPVGAVPAQVAAARERLRQQSTPVSRLKLYNAGSFFDAGAVPVSDYAAIAEQLSGLEHVIVESHPALIGPRVDDLLAALRHAAGATAPPSLEVAVGLETAHPSALEQLNKRMTLAQFAEATRTLHRRAIDVRAFVLVGVPFIAPGEQDAWLLRTLEYAFALGVSVVSLVPTRSGNGALDVLSHDGIFAEPSLADLERSANLAVGLFAPRGRVFVDVWDLERFSRCPHCLDARRARLRAMNVTQTVSPMLSCRRCRS